METTDWPKQFRNRKLSWYWWWRETKFCDELKEKSWASKTPSRRDKELGAFRFEMARRFKREQPGNSYPQADPIVRDLLAPFTTPAAPIIIGKNKKTGRRAKYIKLPIVAFCAKASLGTILEEIRRLISRECKKKNITLPKGPVGRQNRPPSWKRLELLDRKDILKEKKFEDNYRAMIADARIDSKAYSKQFRKLLLEQDQNDSQD